MTAGALSLATNWKIPAVSLRQITRVWHIDVGNTLPRNGFVISFPVTLSSHEFVIESRRIGPRPRQKNGDCGVWPGLLRYFGQFRYGNETPLGLFSILRLYKSLLRTMQGGFHENVLVAGINYTNDKETREKPHCRETTHRRRNIEMRVYEGVHYRLLRHMNSETVGK
jgi:hypothetical protein